MNGSDLALCLKAGFIDCNIDTDERFLPKILTNSQEKKLKVLNNVIREMSHCDYFFFSVAFVTKSGVALLLDILKDLQERNIKGRILASQYQNFTEPDALRRLMKFPNIELKIITSDYNFHAKGYLFHRAPDEYSPEDDNYTMIVGSSNLTASALTVNREWNVQLSSLENGALIKQMQEELEEAWADATIVDEAWLQAYDEIYLKAKRVRLENKSKIIQLYQINPNKMQVDALKGISELRKAGKDRALLISATGTGKTYLAAFDVRVTKPKRLLFLVHRRTIAVKARDSFKNIIDKSITTGMFSGKDKNTEADYLFATVQTLELDANLKMFAPDTFDYIVVDEAHRAGAMGYQKVLEYFKPKFLLGMTATPERTDGYDIFKFFNYNIAYEIRLNQALAENMLVPFHYHGISEITVDGQLLEEGAAFEKLVSEERVKHILYYADFYGCDQGRVKGLVFCSSVEEAETLAKAFVEHGKKACCLSGKDSEDVRMEAIRRLERDDISESEQLDYIFSVDIFNEGIDIPAVNQVILLRPTQSAIIFVQQLGRGLRKFSNKRYLEVIDFIGNYNNNYMLPIALYGDRSYRKERLRHIMHGNFIPGASTVHFEDIVKEKIFESLNNSSIYNMGELKNSYDLVKFKIGRAPMMMDFVTLGDKDPYVFVTKKKSSYYQFRYDIDKDNTPCLSDIEKKLLAFLGMEIINGKRLEESALLLELLEKEVTSLSEFRENLMLKYKVETSISSIKGAINLLTINFFKDSDKRKYGNLPLVEVEGATVCLSMEFKQLLTNCDFRAYVEDCLEYAVYSFMENYNPQRYYYGFKLYGQYSRKDALRILNWQKDESSTVYGYRTKYNTCPIFVTYHKEDDISATTKYEDHFINPHYFSWLTRSGKTLESREVEELRQKDVLKLLFVKKSDGEGTDFYFMGEVITGNHGRDIIQTTIPNAEGKEISIVNFIYQLKPAVSEEMYSYFTKIHSTLEKEIK